MNLNNNVTFAVQISSNISDFRNNSYHLLVFSSGNSDLML